MALYPNRRVLGFEKSKIWRSEPTERGGDAGSPPATLAPTLQWGDDLRVGDYRWKESITIRFSGGDPPSAGTGVS